MKIVTVSREYGAGGNAIARAAAKTLGVEVYDRDIIARTAAASSIEPARIEREGEEITVTETLLRNITPISYEQKDYIFETQREVVLEFARKGPCVIIGRCADVILREAGIESLNVYIYADREDRAQRVGEYIQSQDRVEIFRAMRKKDRARRAYYEHYTGQEWGDCHNYDLALNSGTLGFDECVRFICEAVQRD